MSNKSHIRSMIFPERSNDPPGPRAFYIKVYQEILCQTTTIPIVLGPPQAPTCRSCLASCPNPYKKCSSPNNRFEIGCWSSSSRNDARDGFQSPEDGDRDHPAMARDLPSPIFTELDLAGRSTLPDLYKTANASFTGQLSQYLGSHDKSGHTYSPSTSLDRFVVYGVCCGVKIRPLYSGAHSSLPSQSRTL